MKKYLIIRFLGLLSLVISPALALAASTDFVANGDVTVSSVAGTDITADLIIKDGSQAETVVTGGVLTVTNPDPTARFKVMSSDSSVVSIRVTDSNDDEDDCVTNSSPGVNYVELPIIADTYTVKPSTTDCAAASTASASSGSSGSSIVSIPKLATIPPMVTPVLPGLPSQVSPTVAIALIRGLRLGIVGADVQGLQRFLNANGFVVALSGAGSPGNETTYFGRATQAAVLKFQLAKSIVKSQDEPGAGTVGPKTRALINSMGVGTSASPSTLVSPASVSQIIDPQSLQMLLNLLRQLQAKSNSN